MSRLLKELISASILGEFEKLHRTAKVQRFTTEEPLPFALAALPVIAGGDLEVGGYRRISNYEARLAMTLFRTTSTAVACLLLKAHPGLADEVRAHRWFAKKLTQGPLKRLTPNDQAIKLLRMLLADSHQFFEYQNRRLFDWDSGDVQGAMAVVYGWRQAVTKQRGVFQSVSVIHREAREILSAALAGHPQNVLLQLLDHRFRLAWHSLPATERGQRLDALERLAKRKVRDQRQAGLRLFGLASLVDAGLRFRQGRQAVRFLGQIQRMLVPRQPQHRWILVRRAWAEALDGSKDKAKELASNVARSRDRMLHLSAGQILTTVGEERAARVILGRLKPEFQPRTNPLASATLRIP